MKTDAQESPADGAWLRLDDLEDAANTSLQEHLLCIGVWHAGYFVMLLLPRLRVWITFPSGRPWRGVGEPGR
jgi:hypothetical protein